MQVRLSCLLGSLITASFATVAVAQPATDGTSPGADDTATAAPASDPAQPAGSSTPAATKPEDPDAPKYGIALRVRNVWVPNGIMELFVEHGAGGASNVGFGGELIRRKGTVELQLGFEYEHINIGEGVWVESGKNVATNPEGADYVLSPEHAPDETNFGWFTIEFTFLNHAKINKYLAFRYGGGADIGIMTGGVYHYDIVACGPGATNDNVEPCKPAQAGGTGAASGPPVKYDLPPVFPVVNAIVGLQIKPTDKAVINIETGIRTMPFFGVSGGYFF